jgi:hypothetical protein
MTIWYHYSCLDCGHGGWTRDREGYLRGRYACVRCGGLRFEVEEQDAAPLPENDDQAPEIDE